MSVKKSAGIVTAYGSAVQGGYKGTYEEFCALLAEIPNVINDLENMTVDVTTLAAGSSATASYTDGVLTLGIPKGDQGDKGDKGDKGNKGDTGATPAFSIGTVTTGAAGTNAAATITGTAAAPVLNLTIPKGADGAVPAAAIAGTEATTTASKAYAVGDRFFLGGTLYVATAPIASGGTITVSGSGANCKADVLGDDVSSLKESIRVDSEQLDCAEYIEVPFVDSGAGSVKSSDGTIISSSRFHYTDYIDVSKYYEITYSRTTYTSTGSNWGIAFYDADKHYLYGKGALNSQASYVYTDDKIRIGKNAKYCRATIYADVGTYGTFSMRGKVRTSQLLDYSSNLWGFGDVFASGTKHYYLDSFLPAGTYTLEFDAIGTSNSLAIYFLKSETTAIQAAYSVSTLVGGMNQHAKYTFTTTDVAKSIGFCAANTISASTGYYAYFYNIKLTAETAIDNAEVKVTLHDEELSENTYNAKVIDYSNKFVRGGWIDLKNSPTSISNIQSNSDYSYVVIPCKSGDRFVSVSYGQTTPRAWGFIDSDGNILANAAVGTSVHSGAPLTPTQLKAPPGSVYFIVNHYHYSQLGYNPKAFKLSGNAIIDQVAYSKHILPMRIDEEWKRKVVSVYENYIVIKDGNVLKRSDDCGMTWNTGVNVSAVGTIVSYHMYATGTLAFFTDQKAYYISDWSFSPSIYSHNTQLWKTSRLLLL